MSTKKNQNDPRQLHASSIFSDEKANKIEWGTNEKNLGDGIENCRANDSKPESDSSLESGEISDDMRIENGVFLGEELFVEMVEAAIQAWFDKHNDNIMEKIVENHILQPKKKNTKK